MTEKELEKLFKSKLDNQKFEFNPANWEAMEAMLDSEPAPAGTFYWRSVAAILLFAVGVWSMINFMPQSPQTEVVDDVKSNTIEQPNPVVEKTEEPALMAEPNVESVAANPDQAEAENKAPAGKSKEEVMHDQAESAAVVANNDSKEQQPETKAGGNEAQTSENVEVDYFDTEPLIPFDHKGVEYQHELVSRGAVISPLKRDEVNFTPEALGKYRSRKFFYVEVAPIFTGSYNANNVGVGWEAGIGYQYEFDNNLVVNAGVNYVVMDGVDISSTTDSVFYNFGREVVQTEKLSKRLDYVEVPLSIGYKLNEKHMLQVGAYAGYLVSVSQEVNKEISAFKRETQYEQLTKRGYQDDFYRWDFGMNFGYRYSLTPALSVGLHYNLGLRDITKDTGGEYQFRHTNQSTRVIFRYSFL